MQKGDTLVIVREKDTDPETSNRTAMAAALATIGIALDEDCPFQETWEVVNEVQERVVTWVFKPKSNCGRYQTQEMIEAWDDPSFVVQNPEHPFAYVKAALGNHTRLVEQISRHAPIAIIRKGRRMAFIPFDVAPERREELLNELEK